MLSLTKIKSTLLKNKKLLIFIILLISIIFIFIVIQSQTNTLDKFGIKELYRTTPGGREWFSTWDNGHARSWVGPYYDPDDPMLWTKGSEGSYSTDGNGILKISGSAPRLFIIDPDRVKSWHNVEITVYGMRISDKNIAAAGIEAFARTNHVKSTDYCDTRGYAGGFRYDGNIQFMKEIKHDTSYAYAATKSKWSGGMPYNQWIGYKFVIYDLPDGNVKLELYSDATDGLNGGNWVKETEFTDNGNNFGVGYTPCASDIDPALRLTSSDNRPGSEGGAPNLDVYFKSDGVGTNGLLFKKASVREIDPLPFFPFPSIFFP